MWIHLEVRPCSLLSSTEACVILALQALSKDVLLSLKSAAQLYSVSQSTFSDQRTELRLKCNSAARSIKLTICKKFTIVQHVLDLDLWECSPTKGMVHDMVNKLLTEHGRDPIEKCWLDNFIKQTSDLKTQWTRAYDHQRALNKNLQVIKKWFDLVRSTKEKFEILNKDTYNFDKTGFTMNIISLQLVVTDAYKRKRLKLV